MPHRLTREQADTLVQLPKRIGEKIRWQAVAGSRNRHRFLTLVACEDLDEPMYLVGTVGRTNWSFALLTKSKIPVRKLTAHAGGHTNPDGSDAGTHHKHVWDEVHEDRETYYPEDIDFSDINAALEGFLQECNIQTTQPPEKLAIQRRLR
jgi:hypothetical protein